MIIACPACTTRYVVPDSAIGVEGRTVRCAKCRHSWFQDGPDVAGAPGTAAAAPPPPPPRPVEPEPVAVPETSGPEARTVFAPRTPAEEPEAAAGDTAPAPPPAEVGPEPEAGYDPEPEPATAPPAFAAPDEGEAPPPVYVGSPANAVDVVFEQSPSSFEYEPPFRPRRNPAKLWTAAAVAFAVLVAALIGAVSWFGVPDWLPVARSTFGPAQPDLRLEFPPDRQDRRTLPNGTEFFGASGSVTNIGQETRRVPPILIVLRDARERIVYTWEVRPPKRELAPGESVTVNEAVTDVPRSAKIAEIGWKP